MGKGSAGTGGGLWQNGEAGQACAGEVLCKRSPEQRWIWKERRGDTLAGEWHKHAQDKADTKKRCEQAVKSDGMAKLGVRGRQHQA
eukprot:4807799-Pyramimonas_sp.AAC.1